MKSINANFQKSEKHKELLGSYTRLATAVKGKKFSRETILKNFNKLVSRNEYMEKDKKHLINQLYKLSNPIEEAGIGGKNA